MFYKVKVKDHIRVPPSMFDLTTKDAVLKNVKSTYENFSFSQEIINLSGSKSVIIVTEPFHVPRAEMVAKKLNFNYTLSPAVDSPCWEPNKYLTKYFLKEPIAILMYKLQNKL